MKNNLKKMITKLKKIRRSKDYQISIGNLSRP
jgi:hypothetical protein